MQTQELKIQDFFSTTASPKEIPQHLLYEKNIQIPNPTSKLLNVTHILEKIQEELDKKNIKSRNVIYASNAVIGEETEDKPLSIIVPRFQIENIFNEMPVRIGESQLKLITTLEYKNENTLNINMAFSEHILKCSNGLIVRQNIIENNSAFTKKFGFDKFLSSFLNEKWFEDASSILLKYNQDLGVYISEKEEKEIYGDMLKKMHTKNHVVDMNILSLAAKYADNISNPFGRKETGRTYYDFLQDFTNFMSTTEITKHIKKHTALTDYFQETVTL